MEKVRNQSTGGYGMKTKNGLDRKTMDLDEISRPPVHGFDWFFLLTAIFLILIGSLSFLVGMSYALEQSCDGFLVGSPLRYECYDKDIVGVCLYEDKLVVGPAWPFNASLDNKTE